MPFLVPERMGSQKLQFFLGLPCKNLPKVTSKQQGQKKKKKSYLTTKGNKSQTPQARWKPRREAPTLPILEAWTKPVTKKVSMAFPASFWHLHGSLHIRNLKHLLIRKPAASCPLTLWHWRFTLSRHGRLFSLRREKWGRIGSSKRIWGFFGFWIFLLVCFRFSQYFWVTRGTVSPPPNSNTNKLATSWNISLEPKPMCAPIPRGSGGPHGNYVPHRLKMWSCQRAF